MTIYGVDVSSYQGRPDWRRVEGSGISFGFSKVTESTNYVNPTWSHNRSHMLALDGFLPGAYHFLHGGNGAAQARYFLAHAGDVSKFAVALDVEAHGADAATSRAWVAEFKKRTGGHPVIGYYPRWYWDQTGRPDLSFFDSVWQSHYVVGSGSPSALYGKVASSWWTTFGGEPISILQYSSSATVPGISGRCDVNAYRGSLDQLRALALGGSAQPAPAPAQEEILKTLVDLGAAQPRTIKAGARGSLAFELEYQDTSKIHTDAGKDGTRYPSIFPKGGDAPYAVTVQLVLAERPGDGVVVSLASYERDKDEFERDVRFEDVLGRQHIMHANLRMSDQHKYRADLINDSGKDVTVERAYMLIAH